MDEQQRWRVKLDSVWRAWLADPTYHHQRTEVREQRAVRAPEALALLHQLRATRDPDAFKAALQAWSQLPGYSSFKGFGMMFVHQVVNYTDDSEVATDVLLDALSTPSSPEDAAGKIRRLVAHVDKIKKGGQPAVGRVPFVTSLFWSIDAHDEWPCYWESADKVLKRTLGWITQGMEADDRYLLYREIWQASGLSSFDFESILYWIDETSPFTGLDPAMADRCEENAEFYDAWRENGKAYPSAEMARAAERNARALIGELRLVGAPLEDRVGAALGRAVTSRFPNPKYYAECFRADAYVAWSTGTDSKTPSLWLWVTNTGVAVGLHPGWREKGWTAKAAEAVTGHVPDGLEILQFNDHVGRRIEGVGPEGDGSQFLVGRFFPGDGAFGEPAFADAIEAVAAAAQSLIHRISEIGGVPAPDIPTPTGDLARLAAEFKTAAGYPNERAALAKTERIEFATALTAEALTEFDLDMFRKLINTSKYGGPGPMAVLNVSLRDATADDLVKLAGAIDYLLWNTSDPIEERIERVRDAEDLGIKGLGYSVIMKLLAIVYPEQYIPTFTYGGEHGKRLAMQQLELPPLDSSLTRGARQVESNRILREVLEPHFPADAWGKAQFLFWLSNHDGAPTLVAPPPDLSKLNEDLLLESGFLDEVSTLLDEKRQVVFYGPPGTGKTYIAKELAKALAPDPTTRVIVQFHPSTSYEDFFEGYRPRTSDDGTMTYELVPGPLARMADAAAQAPNTKFLMVVDEINRANLPKVFGELLFLLEYRNESIHTLYRPDEPFELPTNLFVIGTMNTADRSIALVDAAMRRRFHFVPFFPEQDQMQGLLRRWLAKNQGDVRIAALVEKVNQDLVLDVGEHLQIGPSYFMREGITEEDLGRIWKYSIEPFVEEQLFGQSDEIKRYRWSEVRDRYWGTLSASPDDPEILEEDAPETIVNPDAS